MPDQKQREPVTWLNYNGRVSINPGRPMGPNTLGEYLWPVTAQYDEATDRTCVGLSHIAPSEITTTQIGGAWVEHLRRMALRRALLANGILR
jgi:hypothetical protein